MRPLQTTRAHRPLRHPSDDQLNEAEVVRDERRLRREDNIRSGSSRHRRRRPTPIAAAKVIAP
jgi:hypothetical protein